jgi:hypothetical protein
MHLHNWTPGDCVLATIILLFAGSSMAAADCSEAKVRRLAEQGNTIASIAETCDMEKDDVKKIVKAARPKSSSDSTNDETAQQGFPEGTSVGQCGCWGPALPSQRQPHPQCRSGYARPSLCNAVCPAGGYMWQGVCA